MKIAMPHLAGYISDNFGGSSEFIIFETEDGTITGKSILKSEIDHKDLASTLKAEGVEVVIANRISRPLIEMLFFSGMEVITRASGEVEKVVRDFLNGELVTGQACKGTLKLE